MTIHRAAPQLERAVRAPGPDDQQRAAIPSAETGDHPAGWQTVTACRARALSWPRGPSLFRKPRQSFFARMKPTAAQEPTDWYRKRAVQAAKGGAPEFSN